MVRVGNTSKQKDWVLRLNIYKIMQKNKLAIVTGNPMKFRELSSKLSDFFECEQRDFSNYHEIQGTPDEIINHKLNAAFQEFKMPVLVDDVSFHFDMLNGFPGPYAKDFFHHISQYEVGERYTGEKIQAACRLGLRFSENDYFVFLGLIHGTIVKARPEEKNIDHFDICVKIDDCDKRMMDLTLEEKNNLSHRGIAMNNLINKIKDLIS